MACDLRPRFSNFESIPVDITYFNNSLIKIIDPCFETPLYNANGERFNVKARSDPATGKLELFDALSVRLNAEEIARLQGFGAFWVSDIVPIEPDDEVTITGLPGM